MKQNNLSRLFVVANVVVRNKSPRLFQTGHSNRGRFALESKTVNDYGYFTRYTAYRAKGKKFSEVL